MGNSHCVPHCHGENVKDFLRRKFSCVSRKRKIDDLVMLALHGGEKQFKKVAGGMTLTKRELDRYYEERDALTNEFDDNIIEIEMYKYGHETPSEYTELDSDEYETDYTESPTYSPELTPVSPKFSDPIMQKMYEEYCEKKWEKELDLISVSDLPELDEYENIPVQKNSTTGQVRPVAKTNTFDSSTNKQKFESKNVEVEAGMEGHATEIKPADTSGERKDTEALDKGAGEYTNACDKSRDQDMHYSGLSNEANDQVLQNSKVKGDFVQENGRQTCPNMKSRHGLPGRITEGLRQRSRVHDRANNTHSKLSNPEPEKSNSDISRTKPACCKASGENLEKKKEEGKKGLLQRIAKNFRRMAGSSKPSNVITVKPASPETTMVNCASEI